MKMRKLDKSAIDEAIKELNSEFINNLPYSPEILFEFANRRVEPEISENISYNLGKKMLDYRLNDKNYFITFLRIVYDVFYGKSPAVDEPTAQVLISQTGAGKTKLREKILKEFPNTVIINSDLYKKFRPDADDIMNEDPIHFGALTGIDCYDHASNILDFATKMKYNILRECAPFSTGELAGVDMEKLKERHYKTKFHIMAVGDIVSAMAIHYRYEADLIEKKQGAKLTSIARHDQSYMGVNEVIKTLDSDSISIYKRGEKNQIPIEISEGLQHKSPIILLQILERERNNSNYQYLQKGSFAVDYDIISSYMHRRNAPREQIKQLEKVKEKGILRKEKINGLGFTGNTLNYLEIIM